MSLTQQEADVLAEVERVGHARIDGIVARLSIPPSAVCRLLASLAVKGKLRVDDSGWLPHYEVAHRD